MAAVNVCVWARSLVNGLRTAASLLELRIADPFLRFQNRKPLGLHYTLSRACSCPASTVAPPRVSLVASPTHQNEGTKGHVGEVIMHVFRISPTLSALLSLGHADRNRQCIDIISV